MNDKARIQEEMKAAMKSRDVRRLGVIRLLLAAIKQREVDERIELNNAQVVAVIDKMLKQRQDSVSQFQQAGRQDLVDQEKFEIEVLQEYMPPPLGEAEITALIQTAVTTLGAASIKDMAAVMALLKPQVQGRADMGYISANIKAKLSG